jgi:hypothetical protein
MNLNPFNQRPTQAPLNREEQKAAFEALKTQYFSGERQPPIPDFPFQPIREVKLSEKDGLKALHSQMQDRGIQETVIQQVGERIQEQTTKDTIKQFYCFHNFQTVHTRWAGLPIKFKICKKCELVK